MTLVDNIVISIFSTISAPLLKMFVLRSTLQWFVAISHAILSNVLDTSTTQYSIYTEKNYL